MTFIVLQMLDKIILISNLNTIDLKKLLTILIVIFCTTLCTTLEAQHRFGVRAGLNNFKFSGELELNESYGFATGFHFGINYTYQFTPQIGLRAELLYTQRGTKHTLFDEDGVDFYVKPLDTKEPFVDFGSADFKMGITNNYFSIPITGQFQLTDKFEVFGGVSIDMMVAPTGGGTYRYQSITQPDNLFFEITYDHQYRKNEAGGFPSSLTTGGFVGQVTTSSQIIEGEPTNIATLTGAYYNFTADEIEERGKRFNFFDAHAIFGINYFISSGFYIGLRGEYGLTDITNDMMDVSLREINDDATFNYRSDNDRSMGLSLSFGFRF